MEDPKQAWVINTRKMGKTTKSASNVMEAPKQASMTNMKKTAKSLAKEPKHTNLVPPPRALPVRHPSQSPPGVLVFIT